MYCYFILHMLKKLFPFFNYYPDYIYLDSAATTLKPISVIDTISKAYEKNTVPATKSFYTPAIITYQESIEKTIFKINDIFKASSFDIFINHSVTIILEKIIQKLIPLLCTKKKITILMPKTAHNAFLYPIINYQNKKYNITIYDYENIQECLKKKYDLLYIPSIDHITGASYNKEDIINYKQNNPETIIIIDGSQSYKSSPLIIHESYGDIFLMSSHKMYGPDSIAIVFIKKNFIKKIFSSVPEQKEFTEKLLYAGSISFASLRSFLETIFFLENNIYNNSILYETQKNYIQNIYASIMKNKNLKIVSPANTVNIISFEHINQHAHDISEIFNHHKICIRSGSICSDSHIFNNGILRISLGCYVDQKDIDRVINVIKQL